MSENIKEFYNTQATKWVSDKPRTISDLVGREAVLKLCKEAAKDKVVLDLGCGEGFFSRKIATIAKKLVGVDLSEEMIRLANEKKGKNQEYFVSDMKAPNIPAHSIDLVIAVMAMHYLKRFKDLVETFKNVERALKRNGEFIFLVPHPLGALINENSKWYIHKKFTFNYARDEEKFFEYKIKLLNEKDFLSVGFYLHSFTTYSNALREAGFVITQISEPAPTPQIVKKYNAKIEEQIPYHLIIRASKI